MTILFRLVTGQLVPNAGSVGRAAARVALVRSLTRPDAHRLLTQDLAQVPPERTLYEFSAGLIRA